MASERAVRWLVMTGVGGFAFLLAAVLIDPTAPCDGDEGHHVVSALRFHRALATHDLGDFARATLKGGRYPFLHGWAGAGVFGVFGASLLAIRMLSALLLGASAAVATALFYRLRPKAHPATGLLPGLAVVLAPECLQNGTIAMLEAPGLFLVTLGVLIYHRHIGTGGHGLALGAGLTAVAALFVKYPYGAYLLIPFLLAELLRARLRFLRVFRPPSLFVWSPAAAALLLWLVIPQSRASVLALLGDAPDAIVREGPVDPLRVPMVQPAVLAFYFGSLFRGISPGLVAGVLLSVGAVLALLRGGLFERVVLAGTILWTILTLGLSYRTFGVDRFLVPVAGVFAALGASGLSAFVAEIRLGGGRRAAVMVAVLALLLVGAGVEALCRAPATLRAARAAVETGPREKEALRWLVSTIETPANLLVVGGWDQLSEDALKIEFLLAHPGARFTDLDVKGIRRDKGLSGTGRLDRWLRGEADGRQPGEKLRWKYVALVTPSAAAFSRPVEPEVLRASYSRAEAVTADSPWHPVAERSDGWATWSLRRAPTPD